MVQPQGDGVRLRERGRRWWCKGKRTRRALMRVMEMTSKLTLEGTGCVVWWERWGIAVVAKVLAANENARQLCLLARS